MLCFAFVASIIGAGVGFAAWCLAHRVQEHSLSLSDLIVKQNAEIMRTIHNQTCTDAFHDFMQYGATCPTCHQTNPKEDT